MNMQALQWNQHYKAVRRRLETPIVRDIINVASVEQSVDEPVALNFIPEVQAMPFSPLFAVANRAKKIVLETAIKHGVTPEEIIGPHRNKPLVHARQETMWRLKKEIHTWSYPRIARFLGGKDHTTVIHGVRRHQRRVDAEARKALMQAEA